MHELKLGHNGSGSYTSCLVSHCVTGINSRCHSTLVLLRLYAVYTQPQWTTGNVMTLDTHVGLLSTFASTFRCYYCRSFTISPLSGWPHNDHNPPEKLLYLCTCDICVIGPTAFVFVLDIIHL